MLVVLGFEPMASQTLATAKQDPQCAHPFYCACDYNVKQQ